MPKHDYAANDLSSEGQDVFYENVFFNPPIMFLLTLVG